jgi:hypothetical protein
MHKKIILIFLLSAPLLGETPKYYGYLNIGPQVLPGGLGGGASLEAFITDKISVSSRYIYTSVVFKGEHSNFDLSSHSFQLKASYYIFKNFYSSLGLGGIATSLGHVNFPRQEQASLLSAGTVVALGHSWSYNSWRFGIEWSNLYTPFINKEKTLPNKRFPIIASAKLHEDLDLIEKGAHLGFLQVFAGWGF